MSHLSYFCLLSISFAFLKKFPSTFTPSGFLVGCLLDWLVGWFGFSLEWLKHLVRALGSQLALQVRHRKKIQALGQDWLLADGGLHCGVIWPRLVHQEQLHNCSFL